MAVEAGGEPQDLGVGQVHLDDRTAIEPKRNGGSCHPGNVEQIRIVLLLDRHGRRKIAVREGKQLVAGFSGPPGRTKEDEIQSEGHGQGRVPGESLSGHVCRLPVMFAAFPVTFAASPPAERFIYPILCEHPEGFPSAHPRATP